MIKIKRVSIIIYFQLLSFNLFCQKSDKWGDQGDSTYCNPVLPADYSDLDAIRVGEDFYAISSTMQFSPGMAVLHSRDLVNWEIIGHVVNDLTSISPELNWDRMNCYGKGLWAGSIRYYNNKFWVYFGTPDDGFFMSTATNAAGPWEPLHQVWKVTGWDDCCFFRDDDGQLYFIATNFAPDNNTHIKYNIHLFKMNPGGKSLVLESDTIIHQSEGSEANKLYKINGLYYHYFSEVKKEGRVMMMERSQHIDGPWEIKQLNHVNKAEDKEPNQGGLIQLNNGDWWFFTHHGSGDWEGRAASLLPVTWIDGWPIVGQPGTDTIGKMVWCHTKPIHLEKPFLKIHTSDDFNATSLQPPWEWNYQPRMDKWSLTERKGFLRLYAFKPLNHGTRNKILQRAGNTITQRSLRTKNNVVTVKLGLHGMYDGQYAGLTHFSTNSISSAGIKQAGTIRYLVYNYKDRSHVKIKIEGDSIWLRSTWNIRGTNQYAYSLNGETFLPFGGTSQLTWGSYRGDRIGLFNFNAIVDKGYIDVDYFDYNYSR
ncbi:glycoside hydrolase 43 family protein [Ferruginibacter paludis]|uniref:glycoside hydrolase family 43 protein n=1 Tax=Ferruginibacter paludis TaxID=1310417 RepID=UPI0025B520B2|nr:glycoside hydrolase 43 family protein [Ferruginibacter paludis]MDN3656062.1 glycoside hydrolase 43 family protein [Ferruginibacter paludis]